MSSPRNPSIDLFRLLAALCVIIVHVQFTNLSGIGTSLRLMSRWAIPFFFIISGYFLAAKFAKDKKFNVLPTVERLVWIFLLWTLIYAPFVVIEHDRATLLKLMTAPTFIYFGIFVHTWFLPALIFGTLFISFCIHYQVKILLPIFSILSIVIALLSGAYNIFDLRFALDDTLARNWLAIPFLYIGFLLFQKGYPNSWVSMLLMIGGASLQFFEAKFLYAQFAFSANAHQFLIGTIPFAIGITGLAFNNLKFLQNPLLSKWGSQYALGIYLIHPALIYILTKALAHSFVTSALWQILFPFIILCLSITILDLIRKYTPKVFNLFMGRHIRD